MSVDSFYEVVSAVCFALTGLWWSVVEGRKDWIKDPGLRSLAGGVYASFLIPGTMALGAQIGGTNTLVWRIIFTIAAILGVYFTIQLLNRTRKSGQTGFFARSRWLVILVYALVLLFGLFPGLANPLGLKPIQVEAFLVCFIILNGHGLAWEMMTHKTDEITQPAAPGS